MMYVLSFLLKFVYSIWWCFTVVMQFLWHLTPSKIDYTSRTCNLDYLAENGHYCENLTGMWKGQYLFSQKLKDENYYADMY